jgi:hypothetical protein
MRKWIFLVLLIAGVAGVCVSFLYNYRHAATLSSIVQRYEFSELNPPSTLVCPGAIVTIIKTNPIVIGVVCRGADSLGLPLHTNLIISDSAVSKAVSELTGSFQLNSAIQKHLTGDVGGKLLKTITVTLSDVKIIEIADSSVFQLMSNRTHYCTEAIAFRRGKGQVISMIKAVIQATAVYRVQFESGLQTDFRTQTIHRIAGNLGLTNGVKSDDTIQGDNLIWGIRDDVDLGSLQLNAAPSTGAGIHRRAIPIDNVATVVLDDQ